jgi:hypothetical protein
MFRILGCTAAALVLATSAFAQDKQPADKPSAKQSAQQQKMKSCNAQASKKGMKGDERQAFMSECLSAEGKKGGQKMTAQQQKMKSCNAQASKKGMKGDERKAFMSQCLSG